jgi:hypothetical protein
MSWTGYGLLTACPSANARACSCSPIISHAIGPPMRPKLNLCALSAPTMHSDGPFLCVDLVVKVLGALRARRVGGFTHLVISFQKDSESAAEKQEAVMPAIAWEKANAAF